MPSRPDRQEARRARLLWLAVFASTLTLYVMTLPPSVLPGDSGELIAASHTLSIAHPPGYPLYLLIGKVFASFVAVGSVAYRYNLLSAVLAAATAALVFATMLRLRVSRLAALGAVLILATLESVWFQATAAEVYALNGFLTVLLVYLGLSGERYGERAPLLLGLVGGLAIAHHLTLVWPLAAALLIFGLAAPVRPRPATWLMAGCMLILGLSTWLYIPVRAHGMPPLSWGATDNLSGTLAHVTAQGYRWRLRALAPGSTALALVGYCRVLANACGIPLLSLAGIGVAAGARPSRASAAAAAGLALLVGLYGFHYAAYNIPDIESHIFPARATLSAAVMAGALWPGPRSKYEIGEHSTSMSGHSSTRRSA